ncbi:MAG: NfeD family protein [Treponema sp.]|jgi:membrane protein implicated in regulation of membrane protease activity|nr:NfeD family protein [Treponema sp.]
MDIYEFFFTPWFWLVLTVGFSLLELACAFNLITIWFALSSFLMIFISGFTEMLDNPIRFRLHLGIFLGLSAVLFIFTRPIAIKKLKIGKEKTNVDSLVEQEAIITKKITKFERGEIKLQGKYWTAISENNNEELNEGVNCIVVKFDGVKAVVRKVKESVTTDVISD